MTEGATTQFGELWAWGLNAYGELGPATTIARLQPTLVRALSRARSSRASPRGHRHWSPSRWATCARCATTSGARARARRTRARARGTARAPPPPGARQPSRVCASPACLFLAGTPSITRSSRRRATSCTRSSSATWSRRGSTRHARDVDKAQPRSAGAHRLAHAPVSQVRAGHALLQGDRARADRRLEQVEELRDHVRVPAVQADRDLWLVRAHLP